MQVYEELEKFGKIEELNVCANLGDHMIGNVYVKYEEEEMAEKMTKNVTAATTARAAILAGTALRRNCTPRTVTGLQVVENARGTSATVTMTL